MECCSAPAVSCLPYDSLVELVEHLKACVDVAASRTGNWQRFCAGDEAVLPFLMRVSCELDEGVSPTILQLLQCAICGDAGKAAGSAPAPKVETLRHYLTF